MSNPGTEPHRILSIPFWEFIGLCALMVALTALSIDIMLPGLPAMGSYFALANANSPQTVVTSYMLGYAIGQVFAGSISDRYGRKPVMLAGLLVFALATIGAMATTSFGLLLVLRFVQGLGGAAPRIVAMAIVRDLFAGRQMARVMSFIMMVFIMVPVVAPAIGGLLIALGDWTWTFAFLLATCLVAIAWSQMRMPETRPAHDRLDLTLVSLGSAWGQVLVTRVTVVYAVAMGLMFGCLLGYIASAQQIFVDTYGLGDRFPLAFGAVALTMSLASFANAQVVERLGMRRLSHMALAGFVAVASILVVIELAGDPSVWVFGSAIGACFFLLGLIFPNLNALAMEPHGHVAGTASSFLGFFTTAAGAILGWVVGQTYDGTSLPLALGFAVLSTLSLVTVRLGDRQGASRS